MASTKNKPAARAARQLVSLVLRVFRDQYFATTGPPQPKR
jgi:hypothetical protein